MASIYDKASLVLIPSGTKTSKVFSQKPVNGDGDFTFSRSTAATRVNADGNIEKETQNLLRYSNVFDNVNWNKINTTITSGQTGFDGSSNAWLLTKTAANGNIYQSQGYSGVQTLSFYVKANTTDWVRLRSGGGYVYFDVANGNIGIRTNDIDSSITFVANGWYRIELVWSGSNGISQLFVADGDGVTSGTSGSVYIQYPQLEDGLVARKYLDATIGAVEGGITDNVPRLDYTDSSCPALLLEPQRTNLVTNSEYFASSDYTPTAIDSVSLSSEVSPEGVANAYEIVENIQNTIHRLLYYFNYSSGETLSFSVFAKSGTGSRRLGILFGCGFGEDNAVFDLTTGEVTTQANGGTGSIVDMGNGWYRCTMTATANNNGTACAQIQMRDGNSEFYLGNGSDSILLYGAQLEAGSYATSYIPTYGTSVTRNADRAEVENGNNVLPTAYPFTLYSEMDVRTIGDEWGASLLNRNINNAYYVIGVNFSKKYSMLARNNTSSSVQSTANATEGTHKICGVFTETTLKLFVDGVLIGSSNNAQSLASAANDLLLGQLRIASDTQIRNTIHQSLVFNQALTDQEAIDLTTI